MTLDLSQKKTDLLLLFLARAFRMFSYGMIAIVMIKNLELKHFTGHEIGIIQFAVILGDRDLLYAVGLWICEVFSSDRFSCGSRFRTCRIGPFWTWG